MNLLLALVFLLAPLAPSAPAVTEKSLEDWFDPAVPFFISDAFWDPARDQVVLTDQITGGLYRWSLADKTLESIERTGADLSREDLLSLASSDAELDPLLEGEIRIEWDGTGLGNVAVFDGRKAFGDDRWRVLAPPPSSPSDSPGSSAAGWSLIPMDKPLPSPSPRTRDQSLLAQAVADLAGRGQRVRPWRWSARDNQFQLIDRRGRAYVFLTESGVFGQKRLKFVGQVESLYSRLMDMADADLSASPDSSVHLRIGENRWNLQMTEDLYSGERTIELVPETAASPIKPWPAAKKSEPKLPASVAGFFRDPKVLAEGPAGQLISCKIRLTQSGVVSLLMLTRQDQTRTLVWTEDDPQPEDVVVFPEGFAVREMPFWRLIGWTPEFSGVLSFGNSRFERAVPILSGGTGVWDPGVATTGLMLLSAENPSLAVWPIVEWPKYASISELKMSAEPVDLVVDPRGAVTILVRDPERGLRLFGLLDAPEPLLDLPEDVQPGFLPELTPTLVSKTESKQTVWTVAGQPPGLIRKETLGIVWSLGQGIAWKPEPEGVILFTTDPSGESDTAVTVLIEGVGEILQAVRLRKSVWLIETESGIVKLDATDVTAPDIVELAPDGEGLRASAGGAIYTQFSAGTADVRMMGSSGEPRSLGRFRKDWVALGTDGNRFFFKDRRTSKFHVVRRIPPPDAHVLAHASGRIDFNYDDPSGVFLCLLDEEFHGVAVRPETPTFLVGPMAPGMYRLDVSAGLYDISGSAFVTMTGSELVLSDIQLIKTLDFIFRRAGAFEETKNREMAKFNYDLYLDLHPTGRMADQARSRLLTFAAEDDRWDEVLKLYQKSPTETRWSSDALYLMLDRLPNVAERTEMARKLLKVAVPDARSARVLFFLYKYSKDPMYRRAVRAPGIPPVYAKFFEASEVGRP